MDLNNSEQKVFNYLNKNKETLKLNPVNLKTIKEEVKLTYPTVINAVRVLEACGKIKLKKIGSSIIAEVEDGF